MKGLKNSGLKLLLKLKAPPFQLFKDLWRVF